MFYNCSPAVKCGNKSGCRIDLHFMVFAAVSIWCQMQPDLLLFNIMFPDTQVPLVSQVPPVPLVPLESTLLTRSVHHHAWSMSTTTSTSFVTNFLMAGKSLIVISFTISFGWKLSGELIAWGVILNIIDKASQGLTYRDCCWPECSNRFQALESRVNHRRCFIRSLRKVTTTIF